MDKRPQMQACKICETPKPETSFELLPSGNRRGQCYSCRTPSRAVDAPKKAKRFFRPLDCKRYIVTAAQNATPVDANFFAALKVAAEHLEAELVVIPMRYKNPTTRWEKNRQEETDEWWSPAVGPYLFNARKKLHPHLILVGDIKIQPTATMPLTGLESLTGAESCIVGHTKMQLKSIPVPCGAFPKILTTTGACTQKNFSDSKAGALGDFHHCLGALVVEIQNSKKFHIRQINADRGDGSFTDLNTHYSPSGVSKAPPALGLVMGDTHARFICPKVDHATFGPGGIVETLNPEVLVFHDVLDGDTVNHHQVGDPFLAEAKRKAGAQSVQGEIQHMVDFINSRSGGRSSVIVESNHHEFLTRWIKEGNWKSDLKNARFYLHTAEKMLESSELTGNGGKYIDPFAYWVKKLGAGDNVRCLGVDESFRLGEIECGLHGHRGPNGARGTLKNLSRLGARVITGHSHTPGIEEGHYQVGTSTPLRLEYTHGPSSWLNTHCVVYATGKRSLITIIEGDWKI